MSNLSDYLRKSKATWAHKESYSCGMGVVEKGLDGFWYASVWVGAKLGKVNELFPCAEVAMGVVERVWKREEGKRNGKGDVCS